MQANIRALEARQPDGEALRRYGEIARIVTGSPAATARDGVAWVRGLVDDLAIGLCPPTA